MDDHHVDFGLSWERRIVGVCVDSGRNDTKQDRRTVKKQCDDNRDDRGIWSRKMFSENECPV